METHSRTYGKGFKPLNKWLESPRQTEGRCKRVQTWIATYLDSAGEAHRITCTNAKKLLERLKSHGNVTFGIQALVGEKLIAINAKKFVEACKA